MLSRMLSCAIQSSFSFRAFSVAPLTLEHVQSKVLEAVKQFKKANVTKLTPQSKFVELGLDSLDIVELVCSMEDNFGFDITTEDAEKVNSIPNAVSIFHQYINKEPLQTKAK